MAIKAQFHLTKFQPTAAWSAGGWSLYQITGDEIADRTVKVDGVVTERHSWCGFLGCFATLPEVMAAIEAAGGE